MASPTVVVFRVVHCGRDEYPGDGLRLELTDPLLPNPRQLDKSFLDAMRVKILDGDEIEISARVVSHRVTRQEPA